MVIFMKIGKILKYTGTLLVGLVGGYILRDYVLFECEDALCDCQDILFTDRPHEHEERRNDTIGFVQNNHSKL